MLFVNKHQMFTIVTTEKTEENFSSSTALCSISSGLSSKVGAIKFFKNDIQVVSRERKGQIQKTQFFVRYFETIWNCWEEFWHFDAHSHDL